MDATLPGLEPMTVGMILDRAVRLYARHAVLFVGIMTVAYVPFLVIYVPFLFLAAGGPAGLNAAALAGLFLTIFSVIAYMLVLLPLSTGAMFFAVSESYLDRQITIFEAYGSALKRFWHLLLAQIIVTMAVTIGMLFCLVPGIFLLACLSMVIPVIMLERLDSIESLKRSWELTEGHRLKILGALLIVIALIFVAQMAVAAIVFLIVGDFESLSFEVANQVTNTLVQIVITPIQSVVLIFLYYDLRIRKEGFDLEVLSQSLHGENPVSGSVST